MRILNFKVDSQVLEQDGDFSDIVSGTSGYLKARFNFSDEWAGCLMIASFFNRGKEYACKLVNNECMIPDEALTDRYFKVQVVGVKRNYKITTTKLKVYQKEE